VTDEASPVLPRLRPLQTSDTVRVVSNTDNLHAFELGTVGMVVRIREYGLALVATADNNYWIYFDDLEVIG
jgi:hypothetical protein